MQQLHHDPPFSPNQEDSHEKHPRTTHIGSIGIGKQAVKPEIDAKCVDGHGCATDQTCRRGCWIRVTVVRFAGAMGPGVA